MKKASLTVLFSLSLLAGAAYAQSDEGGVTMSTDPAKAADVEQRAQSIQQNQEQMPQEQEPMHMKHKSHGKMHHHMKSKAHKGEAASGTTGE